jgi:hypothetical protein
MKLVQENSLRYLIWLGLIIPATFSLSACSKSDDGSDLADAMTTTPEQVQSLADFFNGKSEEFEKVIFHEMIHYFDIDMSEQHVPKIINVSHEHTHSYWEAWTDFLGIFYHIIYKYYLLFVTNLCNVHLTN